MMDFDKLLKSMASFERLAKRPDKSSGGMLFFCPEDNTVLLVKRSLKMSSPGAWGLPGGRPEDEDKTPLQTAERECNEELGNITPNKELIGKHVIKTKDHLYTVFVYSISSNDKHQWSGKIDLDFENEAFDWFDIDDLPDNVHFDLDWIPKKLNKISKQAQIKEVPGGLCFPFAYSEAVKALVRKDDTMICHGLVSAPFAVPPKKYAHAWIEKGNLVYDWQTMEGGIGGEKFRGKGYPKDVFYEIYKPTKIKKYTPQQVVVNCEKHKHTGPWRA